MRAPEYPFPSSPAVSAVMRGNRKTDSKPEVQLRSALHRRGLRFRKNFSIVAGKTRVKPDIVFSARKVAVFIDGCFWHRCPDHGVLPNSNRDYWIWKLEGNNERDTFVSKELTRAGWSVLRVWEHTSIDEAVASVEVLLGQRRTSTT